MRTVIIILFIFSTSTFARLSSNYRSTVEELTIKNSHQVGHLDNVFRGMAPHEEADQLLEFNITDILIFKNQTRSEVDKEIKNLLSLGYKKEQIHHIPFRWNKIKNGKNSCLQTVKALKLINRVSSSEAGKIFFHCTVGEDRTGFLAAIYRLLEEPTDKEELFQTEMCARGYGRANKKKPWKVVKDIRAGITKLYIQLSTLIEERNLTVDNIDSSICNDIDIKEIPSDYDGFHCH